MSLLKHKYLNELFEMQYFHLTTQKGQRSSCHRLHMAALTPIRFIRQGEEGGNGPPEGKFMKLGGKGTFEVLSSKLNVIWAKLGVISLFLMNKTSFSC